MKNDLKDCAPATDGPISPDRSVPVPALVVSTVVREILAGDINLSADEVIKKAKARGLTAPDSSIRYTAHNIKSELKKKLAKGTAPKAVPAAARATKSAAPALVPVPEAVVVAVPAVVAAPAPGLAAVLANVALVNTVVGACGGAESARQVAEAVRACGSVEAFLQHVELVAGIRGA